MIRINFILCLFIIIPIWLISRRKRFVQRRKRFNPYREFLVNILFIYFLWVAYLTLSPFYFTIPILGGRNFYFDTKLFYNLRHMARGYLRLQLLYSVGNIAMFIPFGILIPLIYKKARRFYIIVFLSFMFSLTIELTQVLFTVFRSGTVDDLFFNTLGGVIGYIGYIIIKKLSKRIKVLGKFLIP
ncbi:glycopeptide antibiotics resistance protein [Natranaerovirga pectinivora]|uniref:Glycopeptide antibiotics resistance protein n=1 Tax=Natranaerovirga pectinivora TaxID=682400 RepID=A0A4R3MJQ9_9FIRM|nr:VanZ family protein [Natranaerovirga pectinivora]TCT13974.1 glycopeptide antibiotics resistance protein [Natranaerovirga pectinivora]